MRVQQNVSARRRHAVSSAAAGVLSLVVLGASQSAFAIPAFPGAEGFGANATGGRGGDVYHVTTLADDPTHAIPGSLFYGLYEKNVPAAGRTIVFDVGGTIHLGSNTLDIKNISKVTVAGQTAPSPITIIGNTVQITSSPKPATGPTPETGNIILQYVAIRKGLENSGDSLTIKGAGNTHDVMVDHISASWGEDEVISVAGATNHSENVTIQHSFISESLESGHQFGALIRNNQSEHVSYTHNLFSNNSSRNPRPGTYLGTQLDFEFQNNVIYNWSDRAGYTGGASETETENINMNYVGNYLVAGPSTVGGPTTLAAPAAQGGRRNTAFTKDASNDPLNLHFYQSGNRIDWAAGPARDGQDIGWSAFDNWNGTSHSAFPAADENASPFAYPALANADSADLAYAKAVSAVGAFPYARTATDQRLINELVTYTGTAAKTAAPATEFNDTVNAPTITRSAGWDTDRDGMPDAWEAQHGFNPAAADNNVVTADGYTRLEHYLQSLTLIAAWNADADGTWSDYLNWRGTRPELADSTARFGPGITAPRTVSLDQPATVGQMEFDNANGYTIGAGGGTLTFDVISGVASIAVASGAHTIAAPVVLNRNLNISVGAVGGPSASLTFTGDVAAVGRTIAKSGAGVLQFQNLRADALLLSDGTVRISPKSSAGASAGTTVLKSLAFAPSAPAALDLTNNDAVFDYAGGSPIGTIRGMIAGGYHGGDWAGAGVTSSAAAASTSSAHATALGYAEASEMGVGSFSGQTVDDTSVLVRYTAAGDANLDRTVDLSDFTFLASNFNRSGGATWRNGDFNYDGTVDLTDFTILASNFNYTLPADAGAGNLGANVPEPAAVVSLIAAGACTLSRRRRLLS